MAQRSATERTTKYATTVDDLADAWVFVMEHLPDVGNDPTVVITPRWISTWNSTPDTPTVRTFEVAVSGMVET